MQRRTFIKKTVTAAGAFVIPTIIPASVLGKNAPSNKINVGLIGTGRMGLEDLRGTIKFDQTRVMAVSDVDTLRMEYGKNVIQEFYKNKTGQSNYLDVKMYGDYKEMLLNPGIDAVLISTPDHWHAQPAMEAALAGKHIYLQKPNSLTVVEGRQMSDVVARQGIIMQIGTQQRSSIQFRKAAELVRNGRIGKLHTVKIGLPGDPSGPEVNEMPVPSNLNYDMWLGCTPIMPYHEMRVHPREGFGRPGWLRIENYSPGMISGWGQHHFDSAAWGMDTEYTGPISVEAVAAFPKSGIWDVHGEFMVKAEYENGIEMFTSGAYPNGIRYEGTDGWIFVSRGNYQATASDPVSIDNSRKALDASDPKILESVIGPDEIHLTKSTDHYGNWIEGIENNKQPICDVESGHRACTVCLISHIAMKIPGKLEWNPKTEKFINNEQANTMLSRPQRSPYGTNYVKF